MLKLAKQIASQGLNRNDAREARRQQMGPRVQPDNKPFTYKYSDPDKEFNLGDQIPPVEGPRSRNRSRVAICG